MNIVPKFFVTFLDIPKYDNSGVDETLPTDEIHNHMLLYKKPCTKHTIYNRGVDKHNK